MSLARPRSVLLLLAIAALTGVFAYAQVLYGSLVGTVEDPSGAVVPKAAVTATNKGTGQVLSGTTDDEGRYLFTNLLPGTYDLKITASGFKTVQRNDLAVTANSISRQDIRLDVGTVGDQVVVQASAVQLQTDRADVKTEITTKTIQSLPLNQYRNYQALLDLAPGATPAEFQNSATDTPGRALATRVNGVPRNINQTRNDGAVNVNVWLPHHTAYVAPSETIDTVNVATSSFDPEQGGAGGAAITVITKSGTNQFHGAAFHFHDNQALRSRNFFLAPTQRKPLNITNIFGGTLGGPIIKNKLFFFGSYEGTRERRGTNSILSLPTADLRTGDFSRVGQIIYDPATSRIVNGLIQRDPFPGNRIPADRLSPQGRAILNLVPLPNLSGDLNNFAVGGTGQLDRDQYDTKINWSRNDRHQIWGKYSQMNAISGGRFSLGAAGGPGVGGDPGLGNTRVYMPTFGHTYTFTPTLLIDQNFGISRTDQTVQSTDFGTNFGLTQFRIPGTNDPNDNRYSGLPLFDLDGYTDYGLGASWMPLFRNDRTYTHNTNLTWSKGSHEFRFGYDMVHHQLNHWQPENDSPRGRLAFAGGLTALQGGPQAPNNFNSLAALLLGQTNTMARSIQFLEMSGREWQHGIYARDRWIVNRKLTINYGIRLNYYPLMRRADGAGLERLELATSRNFLGGRGSTPRDAGITTNSVTWAPFLGIAYRATESTVIRTGYSLSPDPLPWSRPLRGWYPYNIVGTFTSANSFTPFRTLAEGIPPVTGPDISSGVVTLPNNIVHRTPLARINRGYIQSWNFTVEQKLPANFITSVGYVGTQMSNQSADLNVNASDRIGLGNAGRPFAPQGRLVDLNVWDGFLSSNYHSLQVQINRQFAQGLLLKGAYTWSKAMNMTDENGWASVLWNSPSQFRRNYARAGFDRTHVFQMAYVYELPFGKGRPFLQSGIGNALAGGWQINGLISAYTGLPFTVVAPGATSDTPGNQQTANQIAPIRLLGGIGRGTPYYDPASFASPNRQFGNMGRNALRRPPIAGMDMSVFRNFRLWEGGTLTFRAEAFNVTNTPRFGTPGTNVGDPAAFMQITSTIDGSDRQFRFGLRLGF